MVVNRGSDMLSPLLRDNTYIGMYFNLLKKIEHKLEYEIEQEKRGKIK